MPDKEGNALPGEPGHWRYNKDQALKASGVEGKATSMKTLEKAKETPPPKAGENIYTKDWAFKLKRDVQEEVLTQRKVKFTSKDREKDMVNKILKSNPKK